MLGAPPIAKARVASQEHLLLDYLNRLERHRAERRAVHIHLSGLARHNQREQHLRIAAATFDTMVKMLQAQSFTLANADLMVVYKAQAQDEVESAIVKLRFLFSDDPLIIDDAQKGTLCTWYDLEKEYDVLVALAQKMLAEEQARRRAEQEKAGLEARAQTKPKGAPFTPELLARVEVGLGQADLSNLTRRQALRIVPPGK